MIHTSSSMSPAHVFGVQHALLSCPSTAASSGSAPHTWTLPSIAVKRRDSVGWKDSDGRQLSQQAALKSGSPTNRDCRMTALFNLTFFHSIFSVGHVTYSAHLHQIPEVNMAIFWTAQNVCVFIRQTAVKLIAFIDMTRVPVKEHHRHTL